MMNCNVHVLYKIIFSNQFNLFWPRTLFLYKGGSSWQWRTHWLTLLQRQLLQKIVIVVVLAKIATTPVVLKPIVRFTTYILCNRTEVLQNRTEDYFTKHKNFTTIYNQIKQRLFTKVIRNAKQQGLG